MISWKDFSAVITSTQAFPDKGAIDEHAPAEP